jgi:hypothetical protein
VPVKVSLREVPVIVHAADDEVGVDTGGKVVACAGVDA